MSLQINVDKNGANPLYRQIIEQITSMVKSGELNAGEKLPSERELAAITGIARGTINKAYEELERNNIIESIQGSGSFVSQKQDILQSDRKEKAIEIINQMILSLKELKFTYQEMDSLAHILIMEKEKNMSRVRVAGVDCNPEALTIFSRQFSFLSNIEFTRFLLFEMEQMPNPEKVLGEFDILLTTTTHYNLLKEMVPTLRDRMVQAAVSPSQQTVIDMATIPTGAEIGIFCSSQQFLGIILKRLSAFEIEMDRVSYILEGQNEDMYDFLSSKQILIIPPDISFCKEGRYREAIGNFEKCGGRLIRFEYQIDRGSLMYIEEQISGILYSKR